MIVLELLIIVGGLVALAGALYAAARGLWRFVRGYRLDHAEWRPAVRTVNGWIVYTVERPGEEQTEVGRVPVDHEDLEDRMLDLEVRADALAETLNRQRRR